LIALAEVAEVEHLVLEVVEVLGAEVVTLVIHLDQEIIHQQVLLKEIMVVLEHLLVLTLMEEVAEVVQVELEDLIQEVIVMVELEFIHL
jgi:hypothetical protein